MNISRKSLVVALALTTAGLALHAAAPDGWILAGSKPANYDTGLDANAMFQVQSSAFLKAKTDSEGFGTLMQSFSATQYAGKRVRFSAWVKSDSVGRWAGLWLRVDGPDAAKGAAPLAFDNMQNRPIKGTSAWKQYEVVLDVNEKAVGIAMGILQDGPGEVWLNSAKFEVVTPTVPTTGAPPAVVPDAPKNLGFDR